MQSWITWQISLWVHFWGDYFDVLNRDEILSGIKRGKWVEHNHPVLCFLTVVWCDQQPPALADLTSLPGWTAAWCWEPQISPLFLRLLSLGSFSTVTGEGTKTDTWGWDHIKALLRSQDHDSKSRRKMWNIPNTWKLDSYLPNNQQVTWATEEELKLGSYNTEHIQTNKNSSQRTIHSHQHTSKRRKNSS